MFHVTEKLMTFVNYSQKKCDCEDSSKVNIPVQKKKKEIHVKTLSSDFDTIIARNSKIRISNFKVVTAWRGTSIDYKYLVSI